MIFFDFSIRKIPNADVFGILLVHYLPKRIGILVGCGNGAHDHYHTFYETHTGG